MLVSYDKFNVLSMPIMQKGKGLGHLIEKHIKFIPGVNEISNEDWKEIEKHPRIQKAIEENSIIVMSEADETEEKHSLADLDIKEAAPIIDKTYNPDLLQKWFDSETRPGVKRKLSERIKKIEAEAAPKKD